MPRHSAALSSPGSRLIASSLIAAAAFLLASPDSSFAQVAARNARTTLPAELLGRLESHENVEYATAGGTSLQLDLYKPIAATQPLPAVVCIHGGGWWKGDRTSFTDFAKALADRGYVAATISYRLSGEAPFPAQIHDCKAAVRFLRANADRYGIAPDRIGVTGLFAGGHLAALLATSGDVAALEGELGTTGVSSRVQAAVPMGAQSDLRRHHENIERSDPIPAGPKPNIWVQFLGGKPSEAPERWRAASPLTHLDSADPPMLFLAGEHDQPTTRAERFRDRMRSLGLPEGFEPIPNAPHAFLNRQAFFDHAVSQAAGWFDRHLKAAEPSAESSCEPSRGD